MNSARLACQLQVTRALNDLSKHTDLSQAQITLEQVSDRMIYGEADPTGLEYKQNLRQRPGYKYSKRALT